MSGRHRQSSVVLFGGDSAINGALSGSARSPEARKEEREEEVAEG